MKVRVFLGVLILLVLFVGCNENITNPEYYYNFKNKSDRCYLKNDKYYVIIDTLKVQTLINFDISTNNNRVNYVEWSWESNDTTYSIISGINYGPIRPVSFSSTLNSGEGNVLFGFNKRMVGDTVLIHGTFIDSKILKHFYYKKDIFFIIKEY
jgi:hypothetical protein